MDILTNNGIPFIHSPPLSKEDLCTCTFIHSKVEKYKRKSLFSFLFSKVRTKKYKIHLFEKELLYSLWDIDSLVSYIDVHS